MEKEFIVAGKRRYTRQIITTVTIVLLYGSYLIGPELGWGESIKAELTWFENLIIVLGLLLMFGAIFWITTMKHHTAGGRLLFNPHELKIVRGDVTEIIPVEMTSDMQLEFKGIDGDVVPQAGILGLIGLTTSGDGSGNMLTFRFNALDYKLNLVFETKEDFNAIGHLFRAIEKIHGFRPVLSEPDEE